MTNDDDQTTAARDAARDALAELRRSYRKHQADVLEADAAIRELEAAIVACIEAHDPLNEELMALVGVGTHRLASALERLGAKSIGWGVGILRGWV